MMESLPLGVFAALERSTLSWAIAATFLVLLPIWLVLFIRSRGDSSLQPGRLVVMIAGLGALLTIPLLGVGVSLLLPANPTAGSSGPAAVKAAALPEVTTASAQGEQEKPAATKVPAQGEQEKPAATATRAAATPTLPAPSPTRVPPTPTQTPSPKPAISASTEPAPDKSRELAAKGRTVFERERCVTCHSINGKGGVIAPDLAGVGERHSAQWILDHFKDPQSISPGTLMPRFNVPDEDFEALTEYLLTLRRQ